jgi:hypothetical protein
MSKSLLRACLLTVGIGLLAVAVAGEKRGEKPPAKKPDKRVEKPVDPEPTPEQQKKITKLIKDLSSEVYSTRKAAGDALLEIGRPALASLRAAAKSDDFETAETANKLIAKIEGNRGRSTIKITTGGSREKGNFEISLISSMEKVTVRDFKAAFSVAIKPADGTLKLYSQPDKEAFKKKHPDVWKEYAASLLDEKLHDDAIKLAMVRELMPQVLRQWDKVRKRQPKPEEIKAMKKMVREKLDKIFKKKKVHVTGDPRKTKPKTKTPAKPKSPRRENPAAGPQLVPLEP